MSVEATDAIDLPHPSEDPDIRYCHEGKQYDVLGVDVRLTIVEYDPDGTAEVAGGIVILEAADEGHILPNEFDRSNAGVSRKAVEGRIPDEGHRAVYSVTGLINSVGQMELAEVDAYSYDDLYYDRLDEIEAAEGDD